MVGLGAVLTLATGIGPLLTTGVSALGPLLTRDLNLTRLEFGSFAVVASASAALLSTPLGWAADRLSQRTGILMLHGFGLGALVTAALSQSMAGLWASAVLGGAALGLANPLTNGMVALRVEPGRRGMLVGVKQTGVQLIQMFTSLAYPLAAALVSWQAGFLVGAIVTVLSLWAALHYLRARPQCTAPRLASRERRRHIKASGLAWLVAYAFLSGFQYQSLAFYLPLFAFEALHLRPEIAAACGVVLGASGLVSRLVWGRLTERFRSPGVPLALIAVFSAVAVGLVAGSSLWGTQALMWTGTALYGLSGTAAAVILLTVVMHLVPRAQAGAVTGRISMGLFAGFATGPVLFGLLADQWGYSTGWVSLLAASVMMMLAPLGLRRLAVPDPPKEEVHVSGETAADLRQADTH
ncbi:MFS transporter [Arthrobacter cavernae]|uniref:MFS transporter n=1 Tax=Arthrobacter cavernae TaxID=2817681 RepID=A0A939HBF6_9MICC|nr:MFS transporter [Arthrobacter cavernae]MBO1267759.1 MFS transporter [Arthrobacter cavernae]